MNLPLSNLQIKAFPMYLNHEYYSDLFESDFLAIIPESFLLIACIVVLLYGVNFSSQSQISSISSQQVTGEEIALSATITPTLRALPTIPSQEIEEIPVTTKSARPQEFRFESPIRQNDEKKRLPVWGILGVNSSWIAILSIVFTLLLFSNNPIENASIFYSYFILDDLSFYFKTIVLIGSAFSILISLQYIQQESLNPFELQVLVLISSLSMLLLISSADFISIYLAIELQSLCFYVMAGVKRENEFSTEAGLKYFLLGAFSSGILLFGFSLQYGFTGTTHFSELSKIFLAWSDGYSSLSSFNSAVFTSSPEVTASSLPSTLLENGLVSDRPGISSLRGCELGMIFILVGFLFKLSAVPFHMWAPDVYEGAPTSVTAFFAIVPKVSIFAICLRLCYQGCYDFMASWQKILILSCIASMIVGALAALSQNKIKRLLAWSSIGHVGYILTAVACATVEGVQAVLFYLVIYIVMTISLFQLVLCPMRREKIYVGEAETVEGSTAMSAGVASNEASVKNNQQIKYTTDLAFLAKTHPIIAITISVTMFSIAGIPPLAGFYSKAFLLFATMSVKQYLLATIVILTSVISCFYYIRIVKIMYFESHLSKVKISSGNDSLYKIKQGVKSSPLTFMGISKESALVFGITFAVLLFFCLNPNPLFIATHKMALSFSQDGWYGLS